MHPADSLWAWSAPGSVSKIPGFVVMDGRLPAGRRSSWLTVARGDRVVALREQPTTATERLQCRIDLNHLGGNVVLKVIIRKEESVNFY